MAKGKGVDARERKFIAHYSVHFNGAAAVRFAGYDTAHPSEYAIELLAKPRIQAEIQKVIDELGDLHFKLGEAVTSDLVRMNNALADPTDLFDADGNVRDPADWPADLKGCIRGIEVEEQMKGGGDGAFLVRTKKIKLESRKAVLDSLAKISGRFVDRTQLLDKNGKPTNPVIAGPNISVTVGPMPKQVDQEQPLPTGKRKKK